VARKKKEADKVVLKKQKEEDKENEKKKRLKRRPREPKTRVLRRLWQWQGSHSTLLRSFLVHQLLHSHLSMKQL
jgi:hypothetical protein